MIRGYSEGANITVLNTIYHKAVKGENGKYGKDSIDIIYKDLDTGEKKLEHIEQPKYTYYMANDDVALQHPEFYISKDLVHPVTCKYSDIKKDIAQNTGNIEYFYDNINNGNYRENDKLFTHPRVFRADMNIEDYYRFEFSKLYKNDTFMPHIVFFDIEVDGIDLNKDFPEPGECPVNAITAIDERNKVCYTLLLENDRNEQIEEFKNTVNIDELKAFIRERLGGWKNEKRFGLDGFEYKLLFYKEEIALIHDFFNLMNYIINPDFALAWNMSFDVTFLIERIKRLGYCVEEIVCHKDFPVKEAFYFVDRTADKHEEKGDYSQISSYIVWLDQLITFASRRKGQHALPNYKLDYVGQVITGVRKLDYSHITTRIAELPYLNYKVFVFYNIMDTIVQKCIESKVDDVSYVFTSCIDNNVRYSKVHRQTVYLANRGIKEFDKWGYIMGCNTNKWNQKVPFPGAYVADPEMMSDYAKMKINSVPVPLYENLDDFDYKRLYPSIYFQTNAASNTIDYKILIEDQVDPHEDRFHNEYFNRTVSFMEDYICRNYIDFGSRYFALGTFEEVYDDVLEFFNTIANPMRGALSYNNYLDGTRYMARKVVQNNEPREMAYITDKSQPRLLATRVNRMINVEEILNEYKDN